jgi:hypothetical protein
MYFRFFSIMTRGLAAFALLSLLSSSSVLHAQEPVRNPSSAAVTSSDQDTHLVPPIQLDQQVQASTAARQKQVQDLTQFLSTPQAVKAMQDAKIDPVQVKTAIPSLSDAELADLSARANHAQSEFAAGVLSNQTLLIIILVLVAVILIAVIH